MHGKLDGYWQTFSNAGLGAGFLGESIWKFTIHHDFTSSEGGGDLEFACAVNKVTVGTFSVSGTRHLHGLRGGREEHIERTFPGGNLKLGSDDDIEISVRATSAITHKGGSFLFLTDTPGCSVQLSVPAAKAAKLMAAVKEGAGFIENFIVS